MENNEILEGKYRILKVLGHGGMGKVYLAENIKLGTLWAVKEIIKKPDSKIDLLAEPNILKKLRHPALPRIFDVLEDCCNIYVIVDFFEGTPLDKKLEQEGKFPEDLVLNWAIQICDVLSYLHSIKPNPIIYRDMKPSNIILTNDGILKLIDFGIAREYKEGSKDDTIYIGTRGYAAPEQYGEGQTGTTTDIYSLGVTLKELVTGCSPNRQKSGNDSINNCKNSIPVELGSILSKCTKLNAADRYQSVDELMSDIKKISKSSNDTLNQNDVENVKWKDKKDNFRKLILTIWGNAEFGCELAYIAASMTDYKVILIDLDLLAPKADIYLNVRKIPDRVTSSEGVFKDSGLNIVMDCAQKNLLSQDILIEASVKRRNLKNLFILTGNYNLDNYEYYKEESLVNLIDKSYQNFDITILLVNRFIYDSYTAVSLIKSDFNIVPVRADIDQFREFNSYMMFLKEKQHIPLGKMLYAAFEYDHTINLPEKVIQEVTEHNYLGSVRYSRKRARYRNLKIPFIRRAGKEVYKDYKVILSRLSILPNGTLLERLRKKGDKYSANIKNPS